MCRPSVRILKVSLSQTPHMLGMVQELPPDWGTPSRCISTAQAQAGHRKSQETTHSLGSKKQIKWVDKLSGEHQVMGLCWPTYSAKLWELLYAALCLWAKCPQGIVFITMQVHHSRFPGYPVCVCMPIPGTHFAQAIAISGKPWGHAGYARWAPR